jgi:DNA (cytosine-5)-methyltransferase 1
MGELTHGSLFAGIGGFDLGFERAGIRTVWQVELDSYCRRVLERHFPHSLRFADIRDCCGIQGPHHCTRKHHLRWVDILSGGFPCQDISNAGKRAGIDGERSGLWSEYSRIIRELRPRYVVVENVAALLGRGMERVLGDLAACGYDAEWDCLPASAFGAYHERDRSFIVAHKSQLNGRPHDLLEAGEEWRASLQSRRFSSMAVAARAERDNTRLGCEPDVARLVRRVPAALDRLEGLGDCIIPQIAEWIGRRIVEGSALTE